MVIVRDASYMSPSKDEEFLHRAFSSAGFVTNVCPANREIWWGINTWFSYFLLGEIIPCWCLLSSEVGNPRMFWVDVLGGFKPLFVPTISSRWVLEWSTVKNIHWVKIIDIPKNWINNWYSWLGSIDTRPSGTIKIQPTWRILWSPDQDRPPECAGGRWTAQRKTFWDIPLVFALWRWKPAIYSRYSDRSTLPKKNLVEVHTPTHHRLSFGMFWLKARLCFGSFSHNRLRLKQNNHSSPFTCVPLFNQRGYGPKFKTAMSPKSCVFVLDSWPIPKWFGWFYQVLCKKKVSLSIFFKANLLGE